MRPFLKVVPGTVIAAKRNPLADVSSPVLQAHRWKFPSAGSWAPLWTCSLPCGPSSLALQVRMSILKLQDCHPGPIKHGPSNSTKDAAGILS